MKLKILNISGTMVKETELPSQFLEPVREDLIKKAVLAIQNKKRQSYGAFEEAGKRHSVRLSKRRRDYRGSYGHGISRMPRKVLSKRGRQLYWVGAFAPGTIGGRKAHPPKPEKLWAWKINTKERRKAIRSAMSATMNRAFVVKRGHLIPQNYPFIVDEGLERISKTKELFKALQKIGFKDELGRVENTGIRAGKGKQRGRRKIAKKGLLLVVSNADLVRKAANNLYGIDVTNVKRLNTDLLAPGGHPGRATIYTTKALEVLNTGLFMKAYKGETKKKEKKAKPKKEKKPKPVKKTTKPKAQAVAAVVKKPEAKK